MVGGSEGGLAQKARGSGVEGCTSVARGHAKVTTSKVRDQNDDGGGDEIQDRGRGGICRGSAGVCDHRKGPADQGGIWVLGALQLCSTPKWGVRGLLGVAGQMETLGSDARTAV